MRCDFRGQISNSDTAAPVSLRTCALGVPDPSVTLQGPFRKPRLGVSLGIGEIPGESQPAPAPDVCLPVSPWNQTWE